MNAHGLHDYGHDEDDPCELCERWNGIPVTRERVRTFYREFGKLARDGGGLVTDGGVGTLMHRWGLSPEHTDLEDDEEMARLIGEGARSSEPQLSPNYEDWVEQTEPLFELASESGDDEEDDPSVQ